MKKSFHSNVNRLAWPFKSFSSQIISPAPLPRPPSMKSSPCFLEAYRPYKSRCSPSSVGSPFCGLARSKWVSLQPPTFRAPLKTTCSFWSFISWRAHERIQTWPCWVCSLTNSTKSLTGWLLPNLSVKMTSRGNYLTRYAMPIWYGCQTCKKKQ